MTKISMSEAAKAVVRRNTEEVQGGGNFEVFEELFADDFLDHTPQPGRTPDKAGARELYKVLRAAFPDFHADIHWQLVDGDRVTTYKTYHGTHKGEFFGIAPTGRKIQFETVDVMRVRGGKITEHWGVANHFPPRRRRKPANRREHDFVCPGWQAPAFRELASVSKNTSNRSLTTALAPDQALAKLRNVITIARRALERQGLAGSAWDWVADLEFRPQNK
jgi:predicted ester cyclase